VKNPSVVPRYNLHLLLGDTTRSPELVASLLSITTEIKGDTKGKTFFFFLEALKKDLAGSYRVEIGVASIGIGDSNSSGVVAI
jgi:hypothetical protein